MSLSFGTKGKAIFVGRKREAKRGAMCHSSSLDGVRFGDGYPLVPLRVGEVPRVVRHNISGLLQRCKMTVA